MRRDLASIGLVVAAAAAVAPSLCGGFVADDHSSVLENPLVLRPGSATAVLTGAFAPDSFGFTRPLRTIEFASDVALFGDGPLSFRVHSLLWHLVATVTLLFVLRKLIGDPRAAFVGALLWAVHPAQVEPVAWISARGDVAMGACALLSILFALRSEGWDLSLAASLVAAAAAMLYKETAVVLPLVVAALRWTGLCRARLLPYVGLCASYALWRVFQPAPFANDPGFVLGGSVAGTFATTTRAIGFYLAETLLPAQSLDWYMSPSTSFADGAVVAWLFVHAALVVSAVTARRRAPLWTVSVAWFYAFLLPAANWPFFIGKPTSERYMYASLAGAALAAGWALVRAPRAAWTAAFVAAAALGVQSFVRARMWVSDDAAFGAVLADHESPGARYYFASVARTKAMDLTRVAVSTPEGPERAETSGRARRLFEESLDHAHRAIDVWRSYDPTSPPKSLILRRFELLASTDCYRVLRPEEALFHAEEAASIRPGLDYYAEYDRALPLLALGYAPQAAAAMKRALESGAAAAGDEIPAFFLRAAARCEADGLFAAAETCCEWAFDSARGDALRREAHERLLAVRKRPRAAGEQAVEAARIRRLDDELSRLRTSCPARTGPASR
jgi:hypothetical protein